MASDQIFFGSGNTSAMRDSLTVAKRKTVVKYRVTQHYHTFVHAFEWGHVVFIVTATTVWQIVNIDIIVLVDIGTNIVTKLVVQIHWQCVTELGRSAAASKKINK
jgi:hypothetical protein